MTLEEFLRWFGDGLSQGWLPALVAAVAGGVLASAVCPCTLPVGLGVAGVVGATEGDSPRRGFPIALAFFLGIVVSLAVLGGLAGRIGSVLTESFGRQWALAMAGVSLVAAAVALAEPRLRVRQLASWRRPGLAGAFAYGFLFSVGTSAAPLLLLLTLSAGAATPLYGLFLATAFGVGRGLPFLIVGLFAGAAARFTRLGQWRRTLQIASGLGLLLVSAYYTRAYLALV